jgi:quercetin dioxygenase-like cupin family protein
MKRFLIAVALIAIAGSAFAQDKVTLITSDAVTFKDNPAFPKGAQTAILVGDPTKAGDVVVMRIKLPANFLVPPHTHPYAEAVTVISGSAGFGLGEKAEKKGDLLKTGGLYAHPANDAHYVWTGSEGAILEVHFIAPGGINYINPADDPRKK